MEEKKRERTKRKQRKKRKKERERKKEKPIGKFAQKYHKFHDVFDL
jgi:hypothetical protein